MKKIICIETGEVFKSLGDASRKYNISTSNLSAAIHGYRPKCGGYTWEYYKEY